MTWKRAVGLSALWTVAATAAVIVIASVLNGFDLVPGSDAAVAFWVAVPAAVLAPIISGWHHRSWKVGLVMPLLAGLFLLLGGFLFLLLWGGRMVAR